MSPKTIYMKCQILFSRKNKKNIINLLSAENAHRVVKVKFFPFRSVSQYLLVLQVIFGTCEVFVFRSVSQ